MSQTNSYRFVHLSDPHLSTPRLHRYRDLFNKRVLSYLSWWKNRRNHYQKPVLDRLMNSLKDSMFDQLVITGDLTHLGLADEFRQVRSWLDSIGDPARISLIPGNHDALIHAYGEQTFDLWQAYMESDPPQENPGPTFPSLRIRGPVAFIGLSSALPTLPFLATGRIDSTQLDSLARILRDTSQQGLFRVVMIHHPLNRVPGHWRRGLTNASDVDAVIRRFGVEMVLHGHTHRSSLEWLEVDDRPEPAKIPVVSVSAASATTERPGFRASYNQYQLLPTASGWELQIRTFRYQPERQQFHHDRQANMRIPIPIPGNVHETGP